MSSSDRSATPSRDQTRPSSSSRSDSLLLTSTRRDSLRRPRPKRTSSSSSSSPRVSYSLDHLASPCPTQSWICFPAVRTSSSHWRVGTTASPTSALSLSPLHSRLTEVKTAARDGGTARQYQIRVLQPVFVLLPIRLQALTDRDRGTARQDKGPGLSPLPL